MQQSNGQRWQAWQILIRFVSRTNGLFRWLCHRFTNFGKPTISANQRNHRHLPARENPISLMLNLTLTTVLSAANIKLTGAAGSQLCEDAGCHRVRRRATYWLKISSFSALSYNRQDLTA